MTSESDLSAIGKRVVVKVWEPESVTKSGIVLPDIAQQRPDVGEVVSVGERVQAKLAVGDVVVFARYAGTEMTLPDGVQYLVLHEDDLQVKLRSAERAVATLRG